MALPSLTPSVVFVSSHAGQGGSERYLELLLQSIDAAWVSEVVALGEGPLVGRLRERGVAVTVIEASGKAGIGPAAWRLRRILTAARPCVVHANGIKAALVGVLATPATRTPVVWVKHDFSWDGWPARLIASRCRLVVAVAHAVTTTFGRRLRKRVRVVPNGIPELRRDRAVGRALALELVGGAEAQVVLLLGRLHPAKGQLELIEAAPAVLASRPAARFALVGGEDPTQPAYAERVRRRVGELRLTEQVRFVGHRDDALEIISGSEAVVIPSVPDERGMGREACPFAALEAMAVGTPVVGYADGGLPEVFGSCARLVPPGDRGALAEGIAQLLDAPELASRLSRCGRERVRTRNSLNSTVAAMQEHYREAAAPERASG